jgi:hypothetical protein
MDHWGTRRQSLSWLENDLTSERDYIDSGFLMLDECLTNFDQTSEKEKATLNGRFARLCGVTTVKGRNLLLACYSLQLDSLGQEAGAVLRPLIEVVELLNYFRDDPNRVDKVIGGELPRAGEIAKAVSGKFKFLRDHLNEEASHFRFGFYSIVHLVDKNTLNLKPVQTHSPETFRRNLSTLAAFETFLLLESIGCLFAAEFDANNLTDRAEKWRSEFKKIFSGILNT